MADKQVEKLMKQLDITEAEALEMIAFDKEVDGMSMKEVDSDLTAEQKKTAKKYKNVGTKKTEYQFTKRERKPDDVKIAIVSQIADFLTKADYVDVNIVNPSKQVDFTIDGTSYSVSLTRHRAPKS